MGAGRTELLESIFGLHPHRVTGSISIGDLHHEMKSVEDAIRAGLALVPEDRKKDGLAIDLAVKSNLSVTTLNELSTFGLLDDSKENMLCDKYISDLGIKVASRDMLVKYLSGGNQQKIVIAKWLATNPKVLLLDEPTRGIDVNAKNEIYKLIRQLADNGLAVVFVSSELPELMTTTDRILVMCEGKITADLNAATATERTILNAALPWETPS
jgi:ribose transport system ATP-binding protein